MLQAQSRACGVRGRALSRRTMAARRFLYVIAAIIFLLLGAGVVWTLFPQALMRMTFVPSIAFAPPPQAGAPDYNEPGAWLSRPGTPNDPATWLPPGVSGTPRTDAVVFFVPPTTYLDKRHWNAPYDDRGADGRAHVLVASQASAFSNVGRVWAPRYRQATVGAFLSAKPDAAQRARSRLCGRRARLRRIRGAGAARRADHPRRPQPGQLPPAPPVARQGGGACDRPADRRGLRRRLAGLDHRRPARARHARLRQRPSRRAACSAGRASANPPIRRSCG